MKKKISKSINSKKTPSKLDSTSTGDARIAYELIKLFSGAMQALNGGCLPLPENWKQCIQTSLKIKGRAGSAKNPEVQQRGIENAKKVITATIVGDRPFIKGTYESGGVYRDNKNLTREYKPHLAEASIALLNENKRCREIEDYERRKQTKAAIEIRLANGESLDSILYNPQTPSDQFNAIWDHLNKDIPLEGLPPPEQLTEKEKARAWLSQGLNLHIRTPDNYQTFILHDDQDKAIAEATTTIKYKRR